jgi:DNA-binding MarR family transcriptional regulator
MNRKMQKQTSRTSRPNVLSIEERVIDLDRYIPTVVGSLTTKLRNSAQVFFDEKFGITRLEWRIISFLAAEGPSSAYDISTTGSLDKAAVSRAVKSLEARGLVTVSPVPKDNRRRTAISLTRAGRKLNDDTFQEIIKRHQRLLAGLSDHDVEQFIAIAKHIEARIPYMDQEAGVSASRFDPTKPPSRAGRPRTVQSNR